MFEESVESFVTQWKPYAADVHLFSRVEGSPLLECLAGGVIFRVFERTGPYAAGVGRAQLIVHPLTERVQKLGTAQRALKVTGLSKLHAQGLVLLRRGNMVVVDAVIPLVTGSFGDLPDDVAAGDWLEFESLAPVHGFVLPKVRQTLPPEPTGESI